LGCSVTANDDRTARAFFEEDCAACTLFDCDPLDGGVMCSSVQIGRFTPDVTAVATASSSRDEECSSTGSTYRAAVSAFPQSCPGEERVDCDPFASEWICSNFVMGSSGASTTTGTTLSEAISTVSTRNESCHADGPNILGAKLAFSEHCSPRCELEDCDPLGRQWRCPAANQVTFHLVM